MNLKFLIRDFFSLHPSERAHKEHVVLGVFNLTAHILFQAFAIRNHFLLAFHVTYEKLI